MKPNLTKYAVIALLLSGGYVISSRSTGNSTKSSSSLGRTVDVTVPQLSPVAAEGQDLFNETCAACHGENGKGSEVGPPLIHEIYNPGHHADTSFILAAANGVRQHHWPYGDMPAQSQVDREDVLKIISFVRETQVANGITN